jgi:hypothetical protein
VLVVVVPVWGVPVSVVDIVHMLVVRHLVVTTAGSVFMLMARVSQVRQRVLVIVPLMRGMGVPLVHVVDMAFSLHARMTAAWSVLVALMPVRVMIGGCHCSSQLC